MQTIFINTRPRHQSEELTKNLLAEELQVKELPLLEIMESPVIDYLLKAIETLAVGDWIVFTSANGVKYAFEYLKIKLGESFFARLEQFNFSAIGEKTAAKIRGYGFEVKFVPGQSNSGGFAKELSEFLSQQKLSNVLLLRGQLASSLLPETLKKDGFKVKDFPVYHTIRLGINSYNQEVLEEILKNEQNKYALIFTSSEAIKAFIDTAGKLAKKLVLDINRRIKEFDFIVIGQETAYCLQNHFIKAKIISQKQSIEHLVSEIKQQYSR